MSDLGRILIADDEETFLYSTADLLREEGYTCACAVDAKTAAELLKDSEYDLLIADIMMPGNANLEFIRDLPRIAEGTPVIIVTGYPSLNSAIESLQLPVVAYIVKPFDFDQLLDKVQSSIRNFRVYRAIRDMQKRLRDWHKELTAVELSLGDTPARTSLVPVSAFLNLTFRNIVGALSDFKRVTEAREIHNFDQEVCHLFNCPRLKALTDAIVEAIDVLESTKESFKSKTLGELRVKLERLSGAE